MHEHITPFLCVGFKNIWFLDMQYLILILAEDPDDKYLAQGQDFPLPVALAAEQAIGELASKTCKL